MNKIKIKNESETLLIKKNQDIYSYAKSGNYHGLQLLLEGNTIYDLNLKDETFDNIISCIIDSEEIKTESKKIYLLKLLNNYNLNFNLQDKYGQTAFHLSYKRKYKDVLEYLISLPNCEYGIKDIYGKLPIEYLLNCDVNQLINASDIIQEESFSTFDSSSIKDDPEINKIICDCISEINRNDDYKFLIDLIKLIPQNKHLVNIEKKNINFFLKNKINQERIDEYFNDFTTKRFNKMFNLKYTSDELNQELNKYKSDFSKKLNEEFIKSLKMCEDNRGIGTVLSGIYLKATTVQEPNFNVYSDTASIISTQWYTQGTDNIDFRCDTINYNVFKDFLNTYSNFIQRVLKTAISTKSVNQTLKVINQSKPLNNKLNNTMSLKQVIWLFLTRFKNNTDINPNYAILLNSILTDDFTGTKTKFKKPEELRNQTTILGIFQQLNPNITLSYLNNLETQIDYNNELSYADNLINQFNLEEDYQFTIRFICAMKANWNINFDSVLLDDQKIRIHNSIFDIYKLCNLIQNIGNNNIKNLLEDILSICIPVNPPILSLTAQQILNIYDSLHYLAAVPPVRVPDIVNPPPVSSSPVSPPPNEEINNSFINSILNLDLPREIVLKLLLETYGFHPKYVKFFLKCYQTVNRLVEGYYPGNLKQIAIGVIESYFLDIEYLGCIEIPQQLPTPETYPREELAKFENIIYSLKTLINLQKCFNNSLSDNKDIHFIKSFVLEEIDYYYKLVERLTDGINLNLKFNDLKPLKMENYLSALSIRNFYQYTSLKKNYYISTLTNLSNETIINNSLNFSSVRFRIINKKECPNDFLSNNGKFIGAIKNNFINDIIQNIPSSQQELYFAYLQQITDEYLKYVISDRIFEIVKKENFIQYGGLVLDFVIQPKKKINYDTLKIIYQRYQLPKKKYFYKISNDYLNNETSWDYEKKYNFYDNDSIINIIKLDKTKFFMSRDELFKKIIEQQNFLLIDTLKKEKDLLEDIEIYGPYAQEICNRNIMKDQYIVNTIYQNTKSYLISENLQVPRELKQHYESFLKALINDLRLSYIDIVNEYYNSTNSNCILNKDSNFYTKVIQIMKTHFEILLQDVYLKTYQSIVAEKKGIWPSPVPDPNPIDKIGPIDIIDDLLIYFLKYPQEDINVNNESISAKLKFSLHEENKDILDLIEKLNEFFLKLSQRYLEDLRSISSNYMRMNINNAICNKLLNLLK